VPGASARGSMPAAAGVTPAIPENYVTAHRHVKLEILPAARLFVAGERVTGLLDISCSSKEVWFGDIALELSGIEGWFTCTRTCLGADLQTRLFSRAPFSRSLCLATLLLHSDLLSERLASAFECCRTRGHFSRRILARSQGQDPVQFRL
jgi:hypothetical protein